MWALRLADRPGSILWSPGAGRVLVLSAISGDERLASVSAKGNSNLRPDANRPGTRLTPGRGRSGQTIEPTPGEINVP